MKPIPADIVADLARRHRENWEALRKRRPKPGKRHVITTRMQVFEAIMDQRVGPAAMEFVLATFASATGQTSEPMECFTCQKPWLPGRPVAAILCTEIIENRRTTAAMLAGLCRSCLFDDTGLMRGLARDFNVDDVRMVAEAGQA